MRPATVTLAVYSLCFPALLHSKSWHDRNASVEWLPRNFDRYRVRTRDSSSEGQFRFADANFATTIDGALTRLSDSHTPILVHARTSQRADFLSLLKENENVTASLEVSAFNNLKAISHLPVSAVAILSSSLTQNSSSVLTPDARSDLEQLQQDITQSTVLINSGAFASAEQMLRQLEITSMTATLVSGVLQGETLVTMETLSEFIHSIESQLQANARDAVLDYLIVTNSTITRFLNDGSITDTEWETLNVVIAVDPFTDNSSFLYQYYEQLLDSFQRITVLPLRDLLCNERNISSASILLLSDTVLTNILNAVFYGGHPYSTPHDILSDAATELVCSEQFFLNTCIVNDTTVYSSGFQTVAQRVYVVIITFLITVLAVLSIVLGCIASEEKKMKRERRNTNTTYDNSPVLTISGHSSYRA